MASKVGYIQRYLLIIRQVKSKPFINIDELIDSVQDQIAYFDDTGRIGISKSTIRRDLRDIRNNFYIDIKYSKSKNGYHISEDDMALSDFEELCEQLDLLGASYADKSLPDFVFMEKRKPKGTEHLQPLIYAIKNRLVTEFFYLKYDNSYSHTRKVEPYALKKFRDRWYLLAPEIDGKLSERGMIKTWGFDRIENLNITHKIFNRNSHINIEEEFKNSFGIFSDKDKSVEEVILSFTPMGGKYNESFPLHESQETLIDNEDEFRIKLNVKLTYDFIMELLSQSEKMRVVAPAHLRDTLIEIHRKAIGLLEE